ncbi:MAG TPA: hypothetical protein VGO47_03890 [Chlamydiales bacterium]|jgi:hypothetical protein|nr:hypothetical protein [Chlamydiales bacterium]
MREILLDREIPHRTSIRNLISKAWEMHFQEMKEELQVRFLFPFLKKKSLISIYLF